MLVSISHWFQLGFVDTLVDALVAKKAKSIEVLMVVMKTETNAQARFSLAKRVDCYLQRANYLQKIIENRALLNQ